jgi:hypothetical protein
MHTLAILPFLALASFASAQNVHPGDVVALSTFSPPGAGHGSVSAVMNEIGDTFLVWEAAVDAPGTPREGLTRIEGAFLRRFSATTWRVFPTEVLGEADPTVLGAGQVFAGGDTCSAPSVAALGNNFIVAWTRSDASNGSDGQIECVTVEVPSTGSVIISNSAPGVGFAVEAIDVQGAGGQSDVISTGASDFVICYVSNTGVTNYAGGNAYDFELRAIAGSLGVGAPSFGAVATLDTSLACDDLPGSIPQVAAVEPSCALDTFGNLVVAYADYRSADRRGIGFDQRGRMEVARFMMGSFALLNAQFVEVRNAENLQRSGHLYRSRSNSEISLAVTDVDVGSGNQNQIGHYDFDYPSANADATIIDFNVGLKSWQPVQVEALQHHGLRVAVTDLDFHGTAAVAYKRPNKSWIAINPLTSIAPQGLAIGHLETDPTDPNRGWAVLLTRGTSSGDARATFMITGL